ncbi:MAG: DUF3300 domain-containing protein, partial [Planctomycetaceae bacterium]|nr:DUF3300 domain-containing protein [Planctomycetaceae bacterium]
MNRTLGLGSRWMVAAATMLAVTSTAWSQPTLSVPDATTSGDEVAIKARVVASELPPAPLPDPQLAASETQVGTAVAPKLSAKELESLVASVALYPDEVLDNILDAVQKPDVLRLAALAQRDKRALPADLPASVKYLADKQAKVLTELNDNLLMMTRLGLAVKAQPDDVVAAIRLVRSKAAELANQSGATQTANYSLPVGGSTYYGDGGVYSGTSYPCYCYYSYGLPSSYYGSGYGYPYYGYGSGYGYGYGYGYPYGSIARLTLGIIYAANGPYPYPYYGFYPYRYGYGYGYGYPAYGSYASIYGPRGGVGYVNSVYGYGPNGALYRSGTSTGTYVGPNGVGTFSAASNSVRYNDGTTAFAAGRGAATVNTANGNTLNVAGAGVAGKTTYGNTTTFGSAGVIGVQGSNGINGVATHTGGGTIVTNPDGSYTFNHATQNSVVSNNSSLTTSHTAQGTNIGSGNGTYAGSTTVQSGNGKGGTVNTTYSNGDLDVNVTPNNANAAVNNKAASSSLANNAGNQTPGNSATSRLSGVNGNSGATNGLSAQGSGSLASLSNSGSNAGGVSGLRNQLSQPGGSNAAATRSLGNGSNAASGLSNRFGGYG